jgi:serine/threonine protein kinase
MNSSKYTDSNYSEDEGLEDYKIDGYHPVHVGEILLDRYIIMQKLGYGHFSTAWLALDNNNGNYVAIKVQKSDERYIQGAYDEIEILQSLAKKNFDKEWIRSLKEYYKDDKEKLSELETVEHTQVVQLLNSFIHNGQNGKHFCMVFEVMGVTLLEIIKRYNYKGIPLPLVRIITKQILIGLDFLHRICHIIHTDLKPENVLVCLTQDELRNIQETGTYVLDTGNNNQNSEENSRNISENKKDKEKEKEITNFEIKEKKIKEEEKESNIESSTTELTLDENNNMSIFIDKEVDLKGVGKKARKKRQRYKKKKKKMLEKYGLSNVEIEDKMTEVINDINLEMEKEQFEENVKNFDLDDIIERPRIASVPKVNLNLYSHEKNKRQKSEENSEESEEIKYDDDENNDIIPFDINLLEYSKSIQGYIKERNRILHDETYRRFAITRNEALSKAKTDDEKIEVYKKFNNEYNTRGKEIDPSIEVKICDIGNACWFDYHFSTIIQTRQYRSPEVLIGVNYNETSDIWSLACIVFELVTGDFLFQPEKGDTFTKNDDHVAKFIYTLGKMPKNFAKRGEYYNKFFTKEGKLRRIKNRKFIGLKDILVKKYHFKEFEAQALTDFLLPMLEYYPERRASARELLRHPWLTMPPNYDYRMSDTEIFKMNMRENLLGNYYDIDERKKDKENDDRDVYSSDSELNEADCEDNDKKAKIQDDEDDDTQLGDNNPDKINIPNYNNSFCMYGQFVDLTSLDQPNPQFDKIIDKDLL